MNENGSPLKQLLRRLYFSVKPSGRMVVLDYPINARPLYSVSNPHSSLLKQIAGNEQVYVNLLNAASRFSDAFYSINDSSKETDPEQPTWNNQYVPGLDIIMLYTILNEFKPKKYIEIGSGTTTKTANKAKKENDLSFTITTIDPSPREEVKQVADKWYQKNIQEIPLELFLNLSENDIVFFDGTHTLLPNSDVTWFFLEIFPILPKGVIVQIHDIYIPYDYPQFMIERYYSENYILGAVLLSNPDKYEILAPNYYISEQSHLAAMLSTIWQHPNLMKVERHGGSFWLKIK